MPGNFFDIDGLDPGEQKALIYAIVLSGRLPSEVYQQLIDMNDPNIDELVAHRLTDEHLVRQLWERWTGPTKLTGYRHNIISGLDNSAQYMSTAFLQEFIVQAFPLGWTAGAQMELNRRVH